MSKLELDYKTLWCVCAH